MEVRVGRMTFVLRRLLLLVPTAVGVTIIAFFMIHLIPGDPARTILGLHATPRAIAILHHQWGLDRPLASQYWLFMDRLLHGNLGQSLYYGVPVSGLVTSRLPATLWLICYAGVLAVAISVPLAMTAASRKDAVRDHVVRAVPLVGLAMPAFWLGLILQTTLAVRLQLFPVTGYGTGVAGHLHAMFLPSLTVGIALCPVVIRSLRASMLNVLGAEFITTARAKGIPGRRLFVRHVLRNAIIPAVTVLGINVGFLIGGTVIVEQVFAVPGIGSLMINSIFQRDFPVVQAVALVFGVMVVLVNLLTDVAYAALDPRVRFDR
jgi:peptide/nickel transport system permease protein